MAEIRNIVTEGFDVRGQVDLINIQSMLDGQFKYLLNYIDHGVKKLTSIPLISRASSIKQLDAMDLHEAYKGWRSLPTITERERGSLFYIISWGTGNYALQLQGKLQAHIDTGKARLAKIHTKNSE